MQALADNCDDHVNRHSNPNLVLHCILGSTKKRLNTKVLFNPFKEKVTAHPIYKSLKLRNSFKANSSDKIPHSP